MNKTEVTNKLLWFLKWICIIWLVALCSKYIFSFGIVSGDSMYPTYHNGEFIGIYHLEKEYKKGDVVSFIYGEDQEDYAYEHIDDHLSYKQSSNSIPGEAHIKRIVGVPGDVITIENEDDLITLYVNDEEVISGEAKPYGIVDQEYKLGPDQYFVLGDNRDVSFDSLFHGPINKSQIVGKIVFAFGV